MSMSPVETTPRRGATALWTTGMLVILAVLLYFGIEGGITLGITSAVSWLAVIALVLMFFTNERSVKTSELERWALLTLWLAVPICWYYRV